MLLIHLGTPRTKHTIADIGGGRYWHRGLEFGLRLCFNQLNGPLAIEININIDGLPIYKSSNDQFWPILFNIHRMPHISPMIIGLFHGKNKPSKIEEFLAPFVDEIEPILRNGVLINGHKLSVRIRTFICDSPARAFIKGMCLVEIETKISENIYD